MLLRPGYQWLRGGRKKLRGKPGDVIFSSQSDTWLISYTVPASLCFSKERKIFQFNMVGSRCVVKGCSISNTSQPHLFLLFLKILKSLGRLEMSLPGFLVCSTMVVLPQCSSTLWCRCRLVHLT